VRRKNYQIVTCRRKYYIDTDTTQKTKKKNAPITNYIWRGLEGPNKSQAKM
jgi:uncharacterized protein YlaI